VDGAAGGNGVAEHLTTALLGAVRSLVGTSHFDLTQDGEQIGGGDLGCRALAETREDERLERPDCLGKRRRRELRFLQRQPLARDGLEGVALGDLLGLALLAGVDAGGELLSRRRTWKI
jgi:hypothetical protein